MNRLCSMTGCDRRARSGSSPLCESHYQGEYRRKVNESGKVCDFNGCGKIVRSAACLYCEKHYVRKYRHGDASTKLVKEITFDHTRFDVLDEDAAWLLGLIWSDGCLRGRNVSISSIDRDLLEVAQRIMGMTNGLYQRSNPAAWSLQFTSRHLSNRLREYGLVEAKSLIVQWPIGLSDELRWAFIRGVLDGDGCVYLRKSRPGQQAVDCRVDWTSGSHEFALSLMRHLNELGVPAHLSERVNPWGTSTWRVIVIKQSSLRALYTGMYPSDEVPKLDRKHDLFKRWFDTPRVRVGRPSARGQ